MGILASFINTITSFVSSLSNKIPSFNMPTSTWSKWSDVVSQCLTVVNIIFPMDQLLLVLGVLISFAFVMFAFYWIQRAINLLRGSG